MTKRMNFRRVIICILFLFSFGLMQAQKESETRNFIKSFRIETGTSLELTNKYGSIQVIPWKKDSVLIRAEIKAFAPNHSRIDKMFEGVSVNISGSKYIIRAQTEFSQSINMLFESFKGMTSKLISYDSRLEINYYVNAPEYVNLKIDNKYGDVYLEDIIGNFSASVSNGSFKAGSLSKGSNLVMAFCDATINNLPSGRIDASFSDIAVNESGDLSINSISSKYDIKKAGKLSIESKRDKFFLDEVATVEGESYFTDFRINKIGTELHITTKYGSVNTDLVEKGFTTVDINSAYSDISLGFDKTAAYNLDIRHINSFVVLPSNENKTEKRTLNEEKKEYLISGTIGRNPGASRVNIDATRGNIYLK